MLNKLYIRTLLFLGLMGFASIALAQRDSLFLSNTIDVFNKQPARESIYLHLDKPNYDFGDTIWYKAYTVIGQKHQPSALSGVLYVELISQSDSLVTRQTIPLLSGMGWSDIPLPFDLKPGSYRIRAYTRWMRNFGPEGFDEQRIVIGGLRPVVARKAEKCDVQFFPEGGELVDGVRSRVAVKAVGINGLGKDTKGTIVDESGNVVADFSTQHLGMGAFALLPVEGKSYRAIINTTGETSFTVNLPQANQSGYTLIINNSEKDSIYLKIATNDYTLLRDKDKTFYIIAQSNGKVYYTTKCKLERTVYTASVDKSRFPEGIAQFTLLSQSGEPMAERIAFIENKAEELNISIHTNTQTYSTRDKVTINITANDGANKPVTGSFSIAVINEAKVSPDENSEGTILNKLLLTSEVKGYIEQPNYYFINPGDKTRSDLDLLMLTQGYRRYQWKQVNINTALNSTTGQQYLPERSQQLSGTITTPAGKPMPNGKVTLLAAKQGVIRDTIADENGRFSFTGLAIIDTATVLIRARKANNGSNVKIVPEKPDYPKIMPAAYPKETIPLDTSKTNAQYTNYQKEQKDFQFRHGKMLKTVNIVAQKVKAKPDLSMSSNLHGGGNADQVIMYDEMTLAPDLATCLLGKVNFVTFSANGTPINTRKNVPMAVIVDGIIMTGDHLNDINPMDVYSIEVLRTSFATAIYGSSLPGMGALLITTKRGVPPVDPASIHPDGLVSIPYIGYYKYRSFYSPRYGSPKSDSEQKHTGSTIYWNPNILTDRGGKAGLDFYNNDSTGIYRVVVEGIDDEGKLGRQVYRYEVK